MAYFSPLKSRQVEDQLYSVRRKARSEPYVPVLGWAFMSFDLLLPVVLKVEDVKLGNAWEREYGDMSDVIRDYPFLENHGR
jgi:hypothetical protein